MSLGYSYIEDKAGIPERLPNGGLYVGETAKGNWGNVPVIPEAHIMTTKNLLSANPPPGAVKIPASYERPGNNAVQHPYHVPYPNMQFKVIQ